MSVSKPRSLAGASRRRLSLAQRLWNDRAGVALIEFAFVLPLLLMMMYGTYELYRFIEINRKLEFSAFTLGDLITNNSTLSPQDLHALMESVDVMLAPHDLPTKGVIVTSIRQPQDPDEPMETLWQCSIPLNLATSQVAPAGASPPVIPLELAGNDQIIVTEIFYPYKSLFGMEITDPFAKTRSLYKMIISRPRYGALVDEMQCI